MTLDELIAAERRAVDDVARTHWGSRDWPESRRKRLYAKMRAFSESAARHPMPNDVSISDAWLQLHLRAKDLAGVTLETGFWDRAA